MSLAPRTHVEVIYEGVDISRDVSTDLVAMTYTDNEGGKSDDISLTLKNNHGRWSGPWLPVEGDQITVTIIKETDKGVERLRCGVCTIDELRYAGKPSTLEINAVSVPIDKTIRRQKKSRAWENVRLSEIAGDVAGTGDLELLYLIENDPLYERKDQRDESDLQFLQRICDDNGFNLKVTDAQLVIYDPVKREQEPPVKTFYQHSSNVLSYEFETQAHDICKTVIVEYSDPKTGELNEFTYNVPGIEQGETYKITQRTESIAEAERLAVAKANEKNRRKVKGTLTVVGETDILSGVNIQLLEFGGFDGVYYVNKAEHNVGSGYVVSLEINRGGGS